MTPLSSRLTLTVLSLLVCATAHAQVTPKDCKPEQKGDAALVEIRPQFFTVQGKLSGFDPCHASVKFRRPAGAALAPLMISVHGGGGINDVRASDQAFHEKGMATLVFDAYDMQGLTGRPSRFWTLQVTNEARQRMLLTTAWAAYQWALTRADIDTRRIYFFGISNGAAVVANLAAMVDPAHVRGIIAEGITPIGLGLPDKTRVPLMLAFGRLDNFGAAQDDMWRWRLTGPCYLNIAFDLSPPGTSQRCSNLNQPQSLIPTPLQWLDSVKAASAPIEVAYFEDMAHSAYFGALTIRKNTWGNGQTLNASVGATPKAREAFMAAMTAFIEKYDRP
jgi:dienelactone hydrolase